MTLGPRPYTAPVSPTRSRWLIASCLLLALAAMAGCGDDDGGTPPAIDAGRSDAGSGMDAGSSSGVDAMLDAPAPITDGARADTSPRLRDASASDCTADTPCTCAAGATCNISCPGGHCIVSCEAGSDCVVDCPDGSCSVGCAENAICDVLCGVMEDTFGGCVAGCSAGATCNVECPGGGCVSMCTEEGSTCHVNCPGGVCTTQCEAPSSVCEVTCSASCHLACGESTSCDQICDSPSLCDRF